jgi:hypothetical protein
MFRQIKVFTHEASKNSVQVHQLLRGAPGGKWMKVDGVDGWRWLGAKGSVRIAQIGYATKRPPPHTTPHSHGPLEHLIRTAKKGKKRPFHTKPRSKRQNNWHTQSSTSYPQHKNCTVDWINEHIINTFPGESHTFFSADSLEDDNNKDEYPQEFLNILNLSGLPPHKLTLKKNATTILFRNLNPRIGACSGTRLNMDDSATS